MKRLILDGQQIQPMVTRMCGAHLYTDELDGTSAAPIFQAFSSFVATLSAMNVANYPLQEISRTSYSLMPLGVFTSTTSSTSLPIRARPSGESTDMTPRLISASS